MENKKSVNVYRGKRTPVGCIVTVNYMPLNPRHDLVSHSPTGFEWGYGGSGPAQLALAMMCHEYGEAKAARIYQTFKWRFLATIKGEEWTINSLGIEHVMAPPVREAI